MSQATAISYRSASDWSRLDPVERLKRMARSAHARIIELEHASGGMFRESLSVEYHLRYAEANLYDHLAGQGGMSDEGSRRACLLELMDGASWSPMGNRLALNEGRYRTQMVLRLADFLTSV
jgi:hypothetical protein